MKISVITVALNAESTINDTINSVAAQKDVEVEHILVDGGSSDRTVVVAKNLGGDNLRIISEKDRGIYDAMNKGIRAATGDLIGFLNADDFFCRTDALFQLTQIAPAYDAVGGAVAILKAHDHGSVLRAYRATGFQPWMITFGHMPPHPGFYVRREALKAVGEFNAELRIGGDFDWMVRFFLIHRRKATFTEKTIVGLRAGGVSTRGISSAAIINSEVYQSLKFHGLTASHVRIWSKYLAKVSQFIRRPVEYPAPLGVRWMPDLDLAKSTIDLDSRSHPAATR